MFNLKTDFTFHCHEIEIACARELHPEMVFALLDASERFVHYEMLVAGLCKFLFSSFIHFRFDLRSIGGVFTKNDLL